MHHDQGETAGRHNAIDAAEAWSCARRHLPADGDQAILLHVQEFADGFLVVPVAVELPEAPPVPSIDTPTTLIVDRVTGAVTRWPLLKLDVLADQYRRYRNNEPLTFDEPTH